MSSSGWRGSAKNPALRWVGSGAVAFLVICLCVQALRSLFRFDPLHIGDLAATAAAMVVIVVLFAVVAKLLALPRRRAAQAIDTVR